MQGQAAIGGKGLKKFRHKLDIELAKLGFGKFQVEHKESPTADIDNALGQRLIQRYAGFCKSTYALFIP